MKCPECGRASPMTLRGEVDANWRGWSHRLNELAACSGRSLSCEELLALEQVVKDEVDYALRRERGQPQTMMERVRWGLGLGRTG